MRVRTLAAALLALCWTPGHAAHTAGLDLTFGSHSYFGLKAKAGVQASEKLTLRPALSLYRSSLTDGTPKTLSLGASYDPGSWLYNGFLAYSPPTGGYRSFSLGGDATRTLYEAPDGADGGLEFAELGGGIAYTRHTDDFQVAARNRRGVLVRRTGSANVGQTDLSLLGAAGFSPVEFSGELDKSLYTEDLDDILARGALVTRIPGLSSVVSGFPDTSVHLRADLTLLERVTPFLSYTHTSFKADAPPSNSWTAGAAWRLKPWRLSASIERYYPGGGSQALNYLTAGAALEF